jgi:hypothetical protein
MATRSLIGIKLDNIVKTIYCHWDGYPDHNGKLLVENYNTPAAIFDLLELGDLSTLAESPAKCTAYHRDRKEPYGMVEARDVDLEDIFTVGKDYGVDYVYVYNENNEWDCFKYDGAQIDILSERVFTVALY